MSNDSYRALLVGTNCSLEVLTIDRANSLKTLQEKVGGWVEVTTSLNGSVTFWLNEEGKLQGLPVNYVATAFWKALTPFTMMGDYLAGPVVITGGVDDDGETLGIPDRVLRAVSIIAEDLRASKGGYCNG